MSNSRVERIRKQVKDFAAQFVQSGQALLGQIVPLDELEQWVREAPGVYRERRYGPLRTLLPFIEQVMSADHSCQDAVARGASQEVGLEQGPCRSNTGPYCRARVRLPLCLAQRSYREIARRSSARQAEHWKWRGREIKLVDGTTVSMPDTADNHEAFHRSKGKEQGLGFPLARLVGIVSLSCATVLDWAMGPYEGKQTGETALLWTLLEHFTPGDVVIADRLYAGYFMIARLMQLGVDVVMRQHQSRLSKKELVRLYRCRWHVELDLRSIKNAMRMDVLRYKIAAMVRKEVAVHLLACNLVRTVTAQAAHLAGVVTRRMSFKAALQTLNGFLHNLRDGPRRGLRQRHAVLLAGIAQLLLPVRPDRVEPRAVKRRPKPHRLLTESRDVARARLEKRQQRVVAEFA